MRCPKNHALQPIEAPSSDGECDRCGQDVFTGSLVLECCSCNYWLCAECGRKSYFSSTQVMAVEADFLDVSDNDQDPAVFF